MSHHDPGEGPHDELVERLRLEYERARAALDDAKKRLDDAIARSRSAGQAQMKVLGDHERERSDYYGASREGVMSTARARTRELATQGLSAPEIQSRLGLTLTETERELIAPIIRREVAAARRARVARSISPPTSQEATSQPERRTRT
jgi:hypothetical protein